MADGVWYINDNADVIDPASFIVSGYATIRIRRAQRNYAYTGNSTTVQLWVRAGGAVSAAMLAIAERERSTAPLPSDVPRPPTTPTPIPTTGSNVPIPSGTPPYPYGIPVYDSQHGVWVWMKVDVTPPVTGSSSSYPSVSLFPSASIFPLS